MALQSPWRQGERAGSVPRCRLMRGETERVRRGPPASPPPSPAPHAVRPDASHPLSGLAWLPTALGRARGRDDTPRSALCPARRWPASLSWRRATVSGANGGSPGRQRLQEGGRSRPRGLCPCRRSSGRRCLRRPQRGEPFLRGGGGVWRRSSAGAGAAPSTGALSWAARRRAVVGRPPRLGPSWRCGAAGRHRPGRGALWRMGRRPLCRAGASGRCGASRGRPRSALACLPRRAWPARAPSGARAPAGGGRRSRGGGATASTGRGSPRTFAPRGARGARGQRGRATHASGVWGCLGCPTAAREDAMTGSRRARPVPRSRGFGRRPWPRAPASSRERSRSAPRGPPARVTSSARGAPPGAVPPVRARGPWGASAPDL